MAATRSPLYPTLVVALKERLGELLTSHEAVLDSYVEAVGPEEHHEFDPENAESILRHWRKTSHEHHVNVILPVIERIAGADGKAWAKKWFRDNEPEWLPFAQLGA